jgi:hypothetical protein
VVFPLAFQVKGRRAPGRTPRWLPIAELVARRASLPDGHLRVVLLRAAHALGLAA